MRISERVFLIGGGAYGISATGDCNMYLVDCSDSLVLIDTGGGNGVSQVLDNIKDMGFDPRNLEVAFITHCHFDHIGGNKIFKEKTECKIAAHQTEVPDLENLGPLTLYDMALENGLSFEPSKVDMILKGGEKVRVGDIEFSIVHTPGHSPGGISIVIKEGNYASLFPGDTVSAQGRLGFINGPGFELQAWKESIKKMISLKPDRIYPGHGVFVLSGALEHLVLYDQKMNSPWVNVVTSIG
jgi:glyoxylase-like metal-dependent hydrolase (beta-lactamase superfamily II)